MENFWGAGAMPLGDQIKATTSATVWSFIGIEGAVVLSGRAIRSNDVGKASMTGFLGIFAIYVMVAVLQLGVMPAEEMAQLSSPQMAGILELAVGPWGAALINIAVILSLAGALLGWTIIAADCPYSAARQGVFMRAFARSNQHGSPSFSLYLTNGIIQLFLIVIYFNESTYQVFYTISTSMIMVPYLLSSLYYLKIAVQKDGFQRMGSGEVAKARVFGFIGTVYGIWMLYSSGLNLLFITSILYAPGLIIYVMGKKEKNEKIFERSYEPAVAVGLIVLAVIALGMIATGKLNPF